MSTQYATSTSGGLPSSRLLEDELTARWAGSRSDQRLASALDAGGVSAATQRQAGDWGSRSSPQLRLLVSEKVSAMAELHSKFLMATTAGAAGSGQLHAGSPDRSPHQFDCTSPQASSGSRQAHQCTAGQRSHAGGADCCAGGRDVQGGVKQAGLGHAYKAAADNTKAATGQLLDPVGLGPAPHIVVASGQAVALPPQPRPAAGGVRQAINMYRLHRSISQRSPMPADRASAPCQLRMQSRSHSISDDAAPRPAESTPGSVARLNALQPQGPPAASCKHHQKVPQRPATVGAPGRPYVADMQPVLIDSSLADEQWPSGGQEVQARQQKQQQQQRRGGSPRSRLLEQPWSNEAKGNSSSSLGGQGFDSRAATPQSVHITPWSDSRGRATCVVLDHKGMLVG